MGRTMIQVIDTKFEEAKLYIPDVYHDDRGFFKETWSQGKYLAAGLDIVWLQDSVSRSRRNVIRGLHVDPRMAKFVQCIKGQIFDVIVDLREESPTYKQWGGFSLTEDNHHQLFVPAGFAHGFLAQADEVVVYYKQSSLFDPAMEGGLSWRDPSVGIEWPLAGEPILSAKDAAL
jgi:dTDP-4-dehydrorhamnose 3,5-epimerase